jgi:hypothetical protein
VFLLRRSKEAAKAPEIKRGVKMTLHHSRDNAHKQVRGSGRGGVGVCVSSLQHVYISISYLLDKLG